MKPIVLRDVTVDLNKNRRLGPLNAEIGRANLSAIIGANGAGKTLLLRAIAGLQTLSRGTITQDDAPLNNPNQPSKTMLLTQRPILLERSVVDNLAYPLKRAGLPKAEIKRRIDEGLVRAGLASRRKQMATSLSGGEQQKLTLVRAFSLEYPWLLLDEPSSHLDPQATQELEALILAFASSKVKVIMVSHNLGQVARLAEQVYYMERGRIVETGPCDQLLRAPKSSALGAFLACERDG